MENIKDQNRMDHLTCFTGIWLAASLLLMGGCIDEFNFLGGDAPPDEVVIQGVFTNSSNPHYVFVGYTGRYGDRSGRPIENAVVKIFDHAGNEEQLSYNHNGMYQLQGHRVKGEPGMAYFIEVVLENGQVYRSFPERMPAPVKADSLSVGLDNRQELSEYGFPIDVWYVTLSVSSPINVQGVKNFFRWKVDRSYVVTEPEGCSTPFTSANSCYFEEAVNPQKLLLFDGENYAGEYISNHPLLTIPASPRHVYHSRHYFNVLQYVVTKGAHQYYERVDQVANQTGSIFDPQPGPMYGNVFREKIGGESEKALGYFSVASVDTVRMFFNRSEMAPLFIPTFCYPGTSSFYEGNCCSCGNLPGASFSRPYYWE